jgi:hypothetical protein
MKAATFVLLFVGCCAAVLELHTRLAIRTDANNAPFMVDDVSGNAFVPTGRFRLLRNGVELSPTGSLSVPLQSGRDGFAAMVTVRPQNATKNEVLSVKLAAGDLRFFIEQIEPGIVAPASFVTLSLNDDAPIASFRFPPLPDGAFVNLTLLVKRVDVSVGFGVTRSDTLQRLFATAQSGTSWRVGSDLSGTLLLVRSAAFFSFDSADGFRDVFSALFQPTATAAAPDGTTSTSGPTTANTTAVSSVSLSRPPSPTSVATTLPARDAPPAPANDQTGLIVGVVLGVVAAVAAAAAVLFFVRKRRQAAEAFASSPSPDSIGATPIRQRYDAVTTSDIAMVEEPRYTVVPPTDGDGIFYDSVPKQQDKIAF